jgi:hypothetical protein
VLLRLPYLALTNMFTVLRLLTDERHRQGQPPLIGFLGQHVTVLRALTAVAVLLVIAALTTGNVRPLDRSRPEGGDMRRSLCQHRQMICRGDICPDYGLAE